MNSKDLVNRVMDNIEGGTIDSEILSEDFVFSGPVPKPLNKKEFIGMMNGLTDAIRDWNFNRFNIQDKGDEITVNVKITGTNTDEINLPGLIKHPATNKKINLPKETLHLKIKNGKVTRINVEAPPDGGVPGIMKQLGIPFPQNIS